MNAVERSHKRRLEARHNTAAMPASLRLQIYKTARYFAYEIGGAAMPPDQATRRIAYAYSHIADIVRATGRTCGVRDSVAWSEISQRLRKSR